MPHFLIKKEEIKDNYIELRDKNTLFHITKVLRIKLNEKIKFIDNNQIVYNCVAVEITNNYLKAEIIKTQKSQRILPYKICLIQSILALDSQNLLIANATQTGVKEIYPVISTNTSVKKSSLKNKVEKWEKIAFENFKQCERADLVKIQEITTLFDALKNFDQKNILIFAERDENITLNNALKDIDTNEKIAVVIGPEGGFSKEEFEFFKKNNYKLISLGNMIYKAPNAVIAGIYGVVSGLENNV